MNFLSRAVAAAELLGSSPSPRKFLVLIHHVANLQQFSLYSTSTGWLKNQKQPRYTAKNPKPELQQSTCSPSEMVVEKKALGFQTKKKKEAEQRLEVPAKEKEEKQGIEISADWPRPSEIPWQTKVANSVNLIGRVRMPVQFQTSPEGKYWAGTIISQEEADNNDNSTSDSPPFWIPVIFEGDLAHIAACHLKEKDCIYVAGQLNSEKPPLTTTQCQANVQVMVHSINFVQDSSQLKKNSAPCKKEEWVIRSSAGVLDDRDIASRNWRDLLKNSKQWCDYREDKRNGLVKPRYPDFKNKDSGVALWLDRAPKWVLPELGELQFDVQLRGMKKLKEGKTDGNSWENLVENPDKWWDNRSNKINVKSPDFKHKDTGEGLWLSNSPTWVLSRLPPLRAKENVPSGESALEPKTI